MVDGLYSRSLHRQALTNFVGLALGEFLRRPFRAPLTSASCERWPFAVQMVSLPNLLITPFNHLVHFLSFVFATFFFKLSLF